ncbi:MAG: MraY family glycosyltransferase [Bacteroidota bacterium]
MIIFFTYDVLRIALAFLFAAGFTFFSIPTIIMLSREKHLHKSANGRDSHDGSVPTLGGIAIFCAIGLSSLVFMHASTLGSLQYFMVGIIIVFIIGVKDDLTVLTALQKFTGELIAFDLLIFFGNFRITDLHGFLGIHDLTMMPSLLLTLLVGFGIINSINLIDGIDGLAASICSLATITFGVWFYMTGQRELLIICAAILGSLIAFLYYNLFSKKNKIFMGDTGSLILGFLLTFFVINFLESAIPGKSVCKINAAPAIALGIMAIPVYDTLRVFWIRILRRQSPFHADRLHLHHILINSGLSHKKATLILVILNIFLIIFAFTLQLFTANIIYIILALFLLCVLMTEVFQHLKRKNSGLQGKTEE